MSDTVQTAAQPAPEVPEKKKRGRKPLTEEQKLQRKVEMRQYFKDYYQNHPEKYNLHPKGYEHSKIYKLTAPGVEKVYIGSSYLPLAKRKAKHMYNLKLAANNTYVEMAKASLTWDIECLKECPLKNRDELEDLELIWIAYYGDKCFNQYKQYSMKAVAHLLDGRYPESYLPPGVKNLPKKKV